jgi:small-conductance mechanosensitive channel
VVIKGLQHPLLHVSRRVTGYFGLAGLFFTLSFAALYFVQHYFSAGRLKIPSILLSPDIIGWLAILLVLYFLADGLRLYCVIRAMGFRIAFAYIVKLVFVNGLMVAESTDAWAKAVATLLRDRVRLSVFSENSRVFAEDYAEEKIAQQVLKLYRRVAVLVKSKG